MNDLERRVEESTDYNRAQPNANDLARLKALLEREGAQNLIGTQVERKLGLLLAMTFNQGFDAGVASVRAENGYVNGFKTALNDVEGTLTRLRATANAWAKPGEGTVRPLVRITINGRQHDVFAPEISYDGIIRITGMSGQPSVTYRGASGSKTEGCLTPGESVQVKVGMVINVAHTTNA